MVSCNTCRGQLPALWAIAKNSGFHIAEKINLVLIRKKKITDESNTWILQGSVYEIVFFSKAGLKL